MPLLGQDKKKRCFQDLSHTGQHQYMLYISHPHIRLQFITSTAPVMGITLGAPTVVLIPVLALTYTIASLIKVHGISLLQTSTIHNTIHSSTPTGTQDQACILHYHYHTQQQTTLQVKPVVCVMLVTNYNLWESCW